LLAKIVSGYRRFSRNHSARLAEAISRAQRAIKSGDLAALTEILAASADAQAAEAAEYISSLD
jgi:hypothetical protein